MTDSDEDSGPDSDSPSGSHVADEKDSDESSSDVPQSKARQVASSDVDEEEDSGSGSEVVDKDDSDFEIKGRTKKSVKKPTTKMPVPQKKARKRVVSSSEDRSVDFF